MDTARPPLRGATPRGPRPAWGQGHAAAAAGAGPAGTTRERRPPAPLKSPPRPASTHLRSRRWPPAPAPAPAGSAPPPSPPGRAHFRAALGAWRTATSVATGLADAHATEFCFGRVVHAWTGAAGVLTSTRSPSCRHRILSVTGHPATPRWMRFGGVGHTRVSGEGTSYSCGDFPPVAVLSARLCPHRDPAGRRSG